MKRTLKKFVALVAVFVMLITAIPVSAASDAATSTWVAENFSAYVPVKNESKPFGFATTHAKKISVKIADPKIGRIECNNRNSMKSYHFYPKSAGKTIITTKVGKKTFKTNVTVYKYTSPISSVKIGNTTISGKKFSKTDTIYLSYDKYVGKKINIKFNWKKGWYSCYMDLKDKNGDDIPNVIQQGKNGLFENLSVHGGKGNYIVSVIFENEKTRGIETLSIVFK